MKKTTLLLGLMTFINLNAQEKLKLTNDTIVTWEKTRKLTWNDFQGKLDPNIFAYAVTSYKIEIVPENVSVDQNENIKNYEQLNVIANFYKNYSWTISDDIDLLKHEQLHFDIAELYARKIRKGFTELKKGKDKKYSSYWNLYSLLWKECRALQKQYDLETNHGAKKAENLKWTEEITKLLEDLGF